MSAVTEEIRVRPADPGERAAVANVIDGAALALDHDRLESALSAGDVLVAEVEGGSVLGALVLDGREVRAVAVRRDRRDRGVGTALVEAAADRRERLVAEFDADVRPFWASLGFAIEPAGEPGRYRGVRPAD